MHSELLGQLEPGSQLESMLEYGLFQCDSGEFVSRFDICDGLKTCLDASDERNCSDEINQGIKTLGLHSHL